MTLRQKQSRFTQMVGLLILYTYQIGYELTLGDAYATTGHKKDSKHYSRLAIDLNLFKNGRYLSTTQAHRPLGEFWIKLGGIWGGNFKNKDGNHYEY